MIYRPRPNHRPIGLAIQCRCSSATPCSMAGRNPRMELATVKAPHGFTLIEMLVVFSLLALLLVIATPRYMASVDHSKEKVRQQNMATLRDALDKFHADQGRFPNELAELVAKQYLRAIPLDPVTGSQAWVVLAQPASTEPGIFDVAPPIETATATEPEAATPPIAGSIAAAVSNPGATPASTSSAIRQPADSGTGTKASNP